MTSAIMAPMNSGAAAARAPPMAAPAYTMAANVTDVDGGSQPSACMDGSAVASIAYADMAAT